MRRSRSRPATSGSCCTARSRVRNAIEAHHGAIEEIDLGAVTAEPMDGTAEKEAKTE